MSDYCTFRNPKDPDDWVCYLKAGHDWPHRPKVSDEAKAFVLNSDSLNEALFHVADLFHTPVTNNYVPWLKADSNDPVYCISDYIDVMHAVIKKFGDQARDE